VIPNPELPITNPKIITIMYATKVNAIKKYIVCFGKLLPRTINNIDKPQESAIIPTIGPIYFAMT